MSKVSVVIPTYNVEKYLRECLDSVVNQTLKDIEIICVNDGSTDNSLEILKEYASKDARIKIIDKPNSGYGHSMNTGIDSATGEYLGIVEPDDYIELNMYETLYNKAKELDLDFIKGNYYRYSDTPNITNEFCENFNKIEIYEKVINPNNYVKTFRGALSIWASIYKIEFLKQNKIRFLQTPGASFQDISFGIKTIFSAQRVLYLKSAFYHYRTNNDNSSVKSNNKIFCVCDEIHELENRYASDPEKMLIVNALKIDKYTWNYNRLDQIGREKFIKTYKKEIKKIFNEERYNQEFLLSGIKDSCSRILNNTEKTSMSFIENVFSVRNSYDKRHKIITVLGTKIKHKRKLKEKEDLNLQIYRLQKENTLLNKFMPKDFLDYIEIHLLEHCNLNCASCTHFCPLAEEYYLDIETFTKDLNRLADLTNRRIGKIRLMGGEPLLHPELNKFMEKAREIFPNTDISLVTNGILLNKQKQDFWDCCYKNDILITISGYPIKIDYGYIEHKAKVNNIRLHIQGGGNAKAEFWHWVLDLNGKQAPTESFKNCYHANKCIFLKNGKLYTCPIIPNICNFNKYFDKHLEVTPLDFIDIYKTENIMEILNFLAKPVPFCRYCDIQHMTWHNTWKVSEKSIKEWT